jgi:hypothetical protein
MIKKPMMDFNPPELSPSVLRQRELSREAVTHLKYVSETIKNERTKTNDLVRQEKQHERRDFAAANRDMTNTVIGSTERAKKINVFDVISGKVNLNDTAGGITKKGEGLLGSAAKSFSQKKSSVNVSPHHNALSHNYNNKYKCFSHQNSQRRIAGAGDPRQLL